MADECKYIVARSNLHNVREQISRFLCDIDTRLITLEGSIEGGVVFSYLWSTSLSGDPTAGYVAADTADYNTVTELRISDFGSSGADTSPFVASLLPEDLIAIYEAVAPHGTCVFEVTAPPIDNGTYFTVPVTQFVLAGQALPALQDNPLDLHLIERREHNLYGPVHRDVDDSTPLEERHILGWNALSKWAADFRMNWRGLWTQQEYQKHDVVLDGLYLMLANKVTTDKAAPENIGSPTWDLPEQPAWQDFSNLSVVGSGHDYVMTETVYLNSIRVWVPIVGSTIRYRIVTVVNGVVTQQDLTLLSANQWNIIGADSIIARAGDTVRVYLEALNEGAETIITGGWTRAPNDNALPPPPESWNMNVQRTILRIDNDDLNSISRRTELLSISVGSSIQFVETLVNVNSITFQTTGPPIDISPDYVEYPVIVVEEGVALPTVGEATTMTAIVTGALATDFVGIPAGWTGNEPIWADVTSYLAFDGVDQGADPTNQYGISLLVQRINISDDWDFLADSGGGGGGGGGGTDPAELVGYLGEAFPTGLYNGGELNIVNAGLNAEVIGGAGVIIDSYTDPVNIPTRVNLSWETQDQLITSPAVAGNIAWFTMADAGTAGPVAGTNLGVFTERDTQPTPAQVRDEIFLGLMIYNGDSWGEVSTPNVVNNVVHTFAEYAKSVNTLSTIISGGAVHEAAGFMLDQSAGVIWEQNRNWHVDKKDPNREAFPDALAFSWRYINYDMTIVSALTNVVDPDNYDNLTAIVPVGGAATRTTIQRLYVDPRGNYWMLYAQNVHDNFLEAMANIGYDSANTIVPFLPAKSILLGYVVTERNETDWLEEHAQFVDVGGKGNAAGGTPSVTSFDGLTDTPSNKLGSAGMFPQVNVAETALEYSFVDYSDISNPPAQLWGGGLGSDIWKANSGNVGIGTTTPTGLLHIAGGSGQTQPALVVKSHSNTDDANRGIQFYLDAVLHASILAGVTGAAGSLVFNTFATEKMRIVSDGEVRVGAATGDVGLGDVNVAGNYYINGVPIINTPQTYLHEDLTDVAPDQHHAKEHIHDGLDGSGQVDYDDLLNKPTIPEQYWENIGGNINNTNTGYVAIGKNAAPATLQIHDTRYTNALIISQSFDLSTASILHGASPPLRIGTNNASSFLQFSTANDVERMRIDPSGDVGIGTGTGAVNAKLHVSSGSSGTTPSADGDEILAENSANAGISILSGATSIGSLYFGSSAGNVRGAVRYSSTDNYMSFSTNGAERMRIFSGGQLSFATTSLLGRFYVSGCSAEGTAAAFARTTTQGIKYWGVGGGNILQSFGATVWNQDNIAANGVIRWRGEGNVERMRINLSDGALRVGFTAPSGLANEKIRVNGNVNLGAGFNYYINGIPISTFIDAPSDGNIYGRQNAAWVSLGSGTGTVSDLASSPTTTQVTITNTGGDNAIILGATASIAGVMTTTQVQKLAAIEDDANNYVHPTFGGEDISVSTIGLSGATVFDDIAISLVSNGEGHVTAASASVGTREMTANDLNAYTKTEVDNLLDDYTQTVITGGLETMTISGATLVSNSLNRVTIGQLVILTGRVAWSTESSGTGQILIQGLTYTCGLTTGAAVNQNNIRNQSSTRNGVSVSIDVGTKYLRVWHMQGQEEQKTAKYDDMRTNGYIDINLSYYTSDTPS